MWNATTGECLVCDDNYGDAEFMGFAINGRCPPYKKPDEA
jgi:hypothetical protein